MGWFTLILMILVITAVVSFVMAAVLRSTGLCMLASAVISEGLLVLYWATQAASSPYPEDVLLGVSIVVMIFTPAFILSAVGSTLLARRVYRKLQQKAQSG